MFHVVWVFARDTVAYKYMPKLRFHWDNVDERRSSLLSNHTTLYSESDNRRLQLSILIFSFSSTIFFPFTKGNSTCMLPFNRLPLPSIRHWTTSSLLHLTVTAHSDSAMTVYNDNQLYPCLCTSYIWPFKSFIPILPTNVLVRATCSGCPTYPGGHWSPSLFWQVSVNCWISWPYMIRSFQDQAANSNRSICQSIPFS